MENSRTCPNCNGKMKKGSVVIISSTGIVPVVTWNSYEKTEEGLLGRKKSEKLTMKLNTKFENSFHCPTCHKVFCEFDTNEK